MTEDRNALALRRLALGQASAREVAEAAGWPPRTAGARLRSLALRGFAERVQVKPPTFASDGRYEWRLTDRGREVAE